MAEKEIVKQNTRKKYTVPFPAVFIIYEKLFLSPLQKIGCDGENWELGQEHFRGKYWMQSTPSSLHDEGWKWLRY